MTFEVNIRAETGEILERWDNVKDFVTYVKFGDEIKLDRISESGHQYISVDVLPTSIRTRYRGDDGDDRKINYIHMNNVLGFDVIPEPMI